MKILKLIDHLQTGSLAIPEEVVELNGKELENLLVVILVTLSTSTPVILSETRLEMYTPARDVRVRRQPERAPSVCGRTRVGCLSRSANPLPR